MNLDKPLLFLDFETTGVDPVLDRIVEMGASVLHPDGHINPDGWKRRFNPGIPIPAAATKCHGITDADVAGERPFQDYAQMIHEKMQGKDLGGYNIGRYDLPLLDEHFRRCGLRLDLTGVRVIDAARIFFKRFPRTLSDAVREFCGREHEEAHGAGPDSRASLDVLQGQLARFEDLRSLSLDDLARYCLPDEDRVPADLAGKLYRDEEGFACFNFGSHADERVKDNLGFCTWMSGKNFPGSTMEVVEAELERCGVYSKSRRRAG